MRRAEASPTIFEIGVPGGSIQVEATGAGTPIVLLHGWALDRTIWRAQIEALSARFRVIAIDRRGFGRSRAPPGLAREINDLVVVRRMLDLPRMVLVGMSQGGRVALHFAHGHPDSVLGIVLQGAPLDGFRPEPRGEDAIPFSSYAALVGQGQIERMKALWRAHPLMRAGAPAARSCLDQLLANYEARDLKANDPGALAPIAGELEDIYAPALIVTGEHDTSWRQLVGDALAYGLPNGRRAVVAGADHLCNLTHPEEYNALLTAFAGRLERAAAPAALASGHESHA